MNGANEQEENEITSDPEEIMISLEQFALKTFQPTQGLKIQFLFHNVN